MVMRWDNSMRAGSAPGSHVPDNALPRAVGCICADGPLGGAALYNRPLRITYGIRPERHEDKA